jgi:hypothetical protein
MLSHYFGENYSEGMFFLCLNCTGVWLNSSENDIERLFFGFRQEFFLLGTIKVFLSFCVREGRLPQLCCILISSRLREC